MTTITDLLVHRIFVRACLLAIVSPLAHGYSGTEYFSYIDHNNQGEPLSAECIQFRWRSTDNIEDYQERLGIADSELGYSIGRFVTADSVDILSRSLDSCVKRTESEFRRSEYVFNGKEYVRSAMYFGDVAYQVDYMVAKEFGTEFCADRITLDVNLSHCWLFDIRPYRTRALSLIAIDEFDRFIPVKFGGEPSDYGFESWREMQP